MQEINLYDLLKYYARNWLILLSAIFVGAIIGLVYTNYIQTPLYKSEATVLVVGERSSQESTIINNNYTELFKSRRVLEPVIKSEGYSGNYEQLSALTSATNAKDTDVIRVSIANADAGKSEQLLAASLETFKKETNSLYGSNNIKIVDAASLPNVPYNVSTLLQLGLSITASFILAAIVLFFIYDYYSTQVPPTKKASASKTTKSKKPTAAKKTANKSASKQANPIVSKRVGSFLNTFFKKPAAVVPKTVKNKPTTVKQP